MGTTKAGNCFYLQSASTLRSHLWIVLNDPVGDYRGIALVNFTEDTGVDPTVVLRPEDGVHPFITKQTMVEYARPLLIKENKLLSVVATGDAAQHDVDCPVDLLTKIRAGVFTSRFAPEKLRRFCAGLFRLRAILAASKHGRSIRLPSRGCITKLPPSQDYGRHSVAALAPVPLILRKMTRRTEGWPRSVTSTN